MLCTSKCLSRFVPPAVWPCPRAFSTFCKGSGNGGHCPARGALSGRCASTGPAAAAGRSGRDVCSPHRPAAGTHRCRCRAPGPAQPGSAVPGSPRSTYDAARASGLRTPVHTLSFNGRAGRTLLHFVPVSSGHRLTGAAAFSQDKHVGICISGAGRFLQMFKAVGVVCSWGGQGGGRLSWCPGPQQWRGRGPTRVTAAAAAPRGTLHLCPLSRAGPLCSGSDRGQKPPFV